MIKTWSVDELAAAVGIRTGDVWTWNPTGGVNSQDVEVVATGERGGTPMIETRQVIRGGFSKGTTEWNELIHFVHMAVLTCEKAERDHYDRGL